MGDLVTEIRKGKSLPLNFNHKSAVKFYRTFLYLDYSFFNKKIP
ncbi:hypothetical protein H733_0012 [Haemophilus influenzae CGSHiCZ412602]|nr:hypothetical protein H733_0012 [Haemophilus influenzae CGSHiCZ412602]EGF14300.1 hypothetical protein HMPREF9095_1638 [Haemophilus aegyptius ATCC 11116]